MCAQRRHAQVRALPDMQLAGFFSFYHYRIEQRLAASKGLL
jgi:hypothetical protein